MKQTLLLALVVPALVAGCGGKSSSTTTAGGGGDAPIPVGIHSCHFVVEGTPYGEHRCDILGGKPAQLQKLSGMEMFNGSLTAAGGSVTLAGQMGDGAQAFTVHLEKEGASWSGTVVPAAASGGGEGMGAGDWWLANSTFVVDDAAGYGGATYGDAWAEPEGD